MRVTWSIDTRPYADHADVVAHLTPDCFEKATRSTIPLLDYWREPSARLESLAAHLGWPAFTPAELSFERQVPVVKGRGKASFTDLMILADQGAVAVEAKYTEPPYEEVKDWLAQGDPMNRALVLDGWLSRISEVTGTLLAASAVNSLPYQLIHRTASACSMPVSQRAVVYQVFDDRHLGYYKHVLGTLAALLGNAAALTMGVLLVPATLHVGSAGALTGGALQAHLQATRAYVFGEASWHPAS